jgi:hypothetical protein
MKQRYIDESDEFFIDENKQSNSNSLRQDNDLFDDNRYVAQQVISIRRIARANNEDWEIVVDKKPVMLLKGTRFSKPEREFLRTPQGMSFMIGGYKNGWKSVSEYKRQVEKCLK